MTRVAQAVTSWHRHPVSVGTWLTVVLVALIVSPSANYHLFDGLPLARPIEFGLLLLTVPLLLSGGLRRLWQASLARVAGWVPSVLLGASVVALVMKGVLFASGGVEGFAACYHSLTDRLPGSACDRHTTTRGIASP